MSSKYVSFVATESQVNVRGNSYGTIELFDDVDILNELARTSQEQCTECVLGPTNVSQSLCILDVPAHMIPKEILRFFGSSLSQISSIRIVRHAVELDRYLAIITVLSGDVARQLISDFGGQTLSSLDNVRCNLLPVANVDFGEHIDDGSNKQCSGGIKHEMSKVSSISNDFIGHCPVCLESFSDALPMSITTFCNHRFHMQCMLMLESSQCPVCRFQHDSVETYDTNCFVCGLRGEPHHAEDRGFAREDALHQSDLWLCLICGFTGCGARHGGHIQRHYEESLHTYAQNTETRQVWDFAGDGYVHRLVLNSPTAGDIAGMGDPASGASNGFAAGASKMVEVSAPHGASETRDPRAPLSQEQEQHLVSAKLEAVARHYNQLLAWQLEQNRLLYETRLQRIRDSTRSSTTAASSLPIAESQLGGSVNKPKSGTKADKSGAKSGKYGPTWRENMIASLRNERAKLLKQVEGARERLARAHREVEVLRELNTSLGNNQAEWQRRSDAAAKVLADAEATYQSEIPLLEEKVRLLMEKLDMIPKSSTGSKQCADDATPTAGACDDDADVS